MRRGILEISLTPSLFPPLLLCPVSLLELNHKRLRADLGSVASNQGQSNLIALGKQSSSLGAATTATPLRDLPTPYRTGIM